MNDDVKILKDQIALLTKKLEKSEAEKYVYENGSAKLYYSLQRKMSEMSKIFNSIDLSAIDMTSKSDATFERLFKLLEKCETISKSAAELGLKAGVTGKEEDDIRKKPFVETIAESRR